MSMQDETASLAANLLYDPTHPHGRPRQSERDPRSSILGALASGEEITRCAAVALVNGAGQILIGFNKKRKVWDIPQGVIEKGEADCEAAVRELQEETGVTIAEDIPLIQVAAVRHVTPGFVKAFENVIFTTSVPIGALDGKAHNAEPDKCEDTYWCHPCQMPYPRGVSLRVYMALAGHSG